jgi:transcriptional regulator with XRE-family HTH domain
MAHEIVPLLERRHLTMCSLPMSGYIRYLVSAAGYDGRIEAIAQKIGASSKSLYKWMAGTSMPSGEHLRALQHLAGVEVKLMDGSPKV